MSNKKFNFAGFRTKFLSLLTILILSIPNGWAAKDDVIYKYGGTKLGTNNSYASYSNTSISSAQNGSTISTASWACTLGSNQSAGLWLGSNSSQKAKMKMSNGSLSEADSICTAIGKTNSATYYAALICRTRFEKVYKVNLTYTTPGGTAPDTVWIVYKADNETVWKVAKKLPADSLSTSGTNFSFGKTITAKARYAFVIHSTNYCQFKVPNLTFYEGASNYTVSSSVSPSGKATVTLGSTSVAGGGTTTATYSNITAGYEFVNWTISGTGASLSSTTANPTTITVGSANVTVTANLQCITPTISAQPATSTTCAVGATPSLSVTAAAGGASLNYQWKQCATIDGSYTNVSSGGNSSSYSPSTAAAGTTYYKCVVTNAATGCSTNVTSDAAQVTVNAASGYCISVYNSSNNGIQNGFSNGGSGYEYTLDFTIPGKDGSSNWPMYWVGENNASQSYSTNATLADMPLYANSSTAKLGLAEGATGTLHIWDDNKASGSNLWVKFQPSGYGLQWGGAGDWNQAANTKPFTVDANDANVYWTDIVTLDGTNNTSWNYYVGLQTASGYVYSGVDDENSDQRGVSRTRSVTAMKVSNGTAGQWKATYLNSEPTGSKGKFRIWDNNTDDYGHNLCCHWVPFYEATYDANGGGAVSTTSVNVGPVCCEGNASARQVTMPAAPEYAHHTFGGWKSSADNVTYAVGTNVSLSQNTTFTAQWTAVPEATITLNNYSGSAVTTGYYVGDDFTLPTTNNYTCGLKTFVGWSTVAVNSATKPTAATYYEPGDHVTLGATNTFYAVFADDNSVEDEITLSSTEVSAGSSTYSSWSGVTDQSDAVYAGNSAGGQNTDNGSIQLRSKNGTSGVVTTTSGGSAKIVAVEWNSYMSQDRTIDIYGKNTAYTAVSDLYGDDSGTLLGSISWTSLSQETELTITGDYAYIGLRSHDGAIYLNNITITWSSGYSNYSTTCMTYYDINTAVSPAASGSVTLSQSSAPEGGTATATAVPAEGYGFGSWAITGGATLSSTSTNPTTITMGSADATITATFLPKCATPTFSPAGSTYTSAQSVTISSSTTGSTIYYTTDGSNPTTGSSHGTAGDASVTINVSSTTTIKAIAVKSGTNANSDIASATYTIKSGKLFSLVTDEDDLAAGDELVIVGYASSTPHVMSTTQNSNNRGMTDVDWEFISSNLFVEDKVSSTVQVITLEGSAGEWYFNVGTDAYLYAASSSSNWLRTTDKTTAGDNAKWDISIGSGDTYYATVIAQGTYTRNMLQYNNNSSIFSCYASNNPQQSIQLYRYANTAPVVNVGMPTGTNFTYVYGNGPSATQTFTINGNNLTGNVVITPPSNYQIKNGSSEWGTSAITLTPDGNGAIAATTISVRLAGGLSAGSYDGNITFTNNDELTIPNIAVTGTVSKATLNPLFEMATYTIVRNVSTSTTFAFVNLPDDYMGAVTYSRTNTPTPSARLVIDGTNKTFTAADYSGRWTVTANFSADANYNLKNGVTCTVNALTRDTYVDNVNSQSVSEEQATDNGVDPYISPALDDVAAGAACQGTKTHLLGWATQAFVTKVGNGTLSGDKSDYTEANGFYAIGTTLPAASNATYYAVWGELDE